ncbi:MAG TPA: SDR family NAD(P)-dependent oxidoreductase [Acetobacteraceae bacterium]|nr:SDR family NAD(P)-dependent oxidoreductase [Acetobacteraceae bacterium]
MTGPVLLVLGLGYSGGAVARAAADAGFRVIGTRRALDGAKTDGVEVLRFAQAAPAIAAATHLLVTAPPDEAGDPVLVRFRAEIAAAPALHWIGYLSSLVVYGNRDGAWVDETSPLAPSGERGRRRVAAEAAWRGAAAGRALDIFRVAGIYGPGRSAFDNLRAGTARRVVKPGHAFSRIHRDDIAAGVLAAIRQDRPSGPRVLHLADDEPAESAAVTKEAARLLGIPPPPAVAFADALPAMSAMARSFWAESRRVRSTATQAALGRAWLHPTYRDGLRAILDEERRDSARKL